MNLYSNYVNWSIFDGEITLEKDARVHILSTVFDSDTTNRDIVLVIDDVRYSARLMNVPSSNSVQISYKQDLKNVFKQIFQYSFDYWMTIRAEAKRINQSTRKLPTQILETISIIETNEPLVYEIQYKSYFTPTNPFDRNNPEPDEGMAFPEGRRVYTNHVRYERNHGVVRLAKERFKAMHGSLYCEACGFSFDIYGDRGKDFIEAHHDVVPVSQMGANSTSSVDDIKMVCSNCHRMLHLKRPWLKVDELKLLLKSY